AYVNGLTYSVGGIVGIGVINPTATTGGMISTGFDGTVTKAETVTVSAVDTVRTNATASGGTGSFGVGIHDVTATAATGPKTTTSVGGTITAHMDVVVESVVFTDTQAISTGVVFAGVAAVSKLSVVATDETKISTDVTGTLTSTAGNIRISAYHDYDAKATPKPKLLDTFQTVASIENTNISLFVHADHGAKSSADAKADPSASTESGSGPPAVNGTITVDSRSANRAEARARASGGAAVSVTEGIDPTATAEGTTSATLAGNVL